MKETLILATKSVEKVMNGFSLFSDPFHDYIFVHISLWNMFVQKYEKQVQGQ